MDAVNLARGRNKPKVNPTTPEIRQCRYCKGKFEVDPKFPHKQFCRETHRKLFWRYGSQSIGKAADRIERDVRKLLDRELKLIRRRLDKIEKSDLMLPVPEEREVVRGSARLLPCKAGPAMLAHAVASCEPGDYFVVALSTDDLPLNHPGPVLAEYTHCASLEDAERKVSEYRKMREVSDAFVLSRVSSGLFAGGPSV